MSLSARSPDWAFYSLPTRAWELLAGALLKDVEDDGIVGIVLLGNLLAGNLLDPLLTDGLAGREEAAVPMGVDGGVGVC